MASCIRVTHPCAGRPPQCIATPVLPLDLHVLSLSLAFILSQDQTLRCFKLFLLISLAQDPFLLHLRLDGLFLVLYYWCDICNFLKDLRNQVSSFLVCGCKSRHYFRMTKCFGRNLQVFSIKFCFALTNKRLSDQVFFFGSAPIAVSKAGYRAAEGNFSLFRLPRNILQEQIHHPLRRHKGADFIPQHLLLPSSRASPRPPDCDRRYPAAYR